MQTKGIGISDIKEGKCVSLTEILENIMNANRFYWALLWLDVTPLKEEGKSILELQEKINQSKNGFICTFDSLIEISKKIFQEINLTIISCKKKENLRRYKEDQDMYETCDIVIEMIDGGFWEVFAKDETLISRLATKFKEIEFLKPDFERSYD